MKTILRILIILLIGTLVAGRIYLIAQNTTLASATNEAPSFDQMPAPPTSDLSEPPTLPEGGDDLNAVSLSRGLSEVGVSTALVDALIQNLEQIANS